MPSYTTWFVEVTLHAGRQIMSPGFDSRGEAEAALSTIRAAQRTSEWVDLDWLSVKGSDILVANVTSSTVGFF